MLFTQLALFIVFSVAWLGCSSLGLTSSNQGNKYKYKYKLSLPAESPNLLYRDDNIYVQFRIDDAAIKFQLQNITADPMEIVWSQASIGIRGRFFPVRNASNLYAESSMCVSSATIPPLGYVTDMAIPAQNIRYDGTSWKEQDLLPTVDRNPEATMDRVQPMVGTHIGLVLPIRVGETLVQYQFAFTVTGVDRIPWSQYRRPARPAPPPRRRMLLTVDQMITAGVLVGVVGVASYWLTMKKVEPSP